MQIYNFFGINSKKVMTFWELIPKKSCFLMLNYITPFINSLYRATPFTVSRYFCLG